MTFMMSDSMYFFDAGISRLIMFFLSESVQFPFFAQDRIKRNPDSVQAVYLVNFVHIVHNKYMTFTV